MAVGGEKIPGLCSSSVAKLDSLHMKSQAGGQAAEGEPCLGRVALAGAEVAVMEAHGIVAEGEALLAVEDPGCIDDVGPCLLEQRPVSGRVGR